MKVKIKILITLCLCFLVFFAGKHKDKVIENDAGGTSFAISGTNADTSEIFDMNANTTFGYARYDTLSGNTDDSLALQVTIQSYIGNFMGSNQWKTEATFEIHGGDSTADRYIYTSGAARSNSRRSRLIVTGIDSNSVDESNFLEIVKFGYEE